MLNQNFIRNFIKNFKGRAGHIALLACLTSIFAIQSFAAPGDFETAFGTNGRATIPNLTGRTKAVAVQPDGKIVMVGTTDADDWFVARVNADGTPDLTFGGGDAFTTVGQPGWGYRDLANAVYVRPADGKIFVAGTMNGERDITFGIFNADGSLATNGPGGGLVQRPNSLNKDFIINGMAVTTDGSFFLCGESIDRNNPANRKMIVTKQLPTGSNDLLFGNLGDPVELAVPFPSVRATACAMMDGYLAVVGTTIETHKRAVVVKMLGNGALAYFWNSKAVFINFAPLGVGSTAQAVAVQPDGKILIAGSWTQSQNNPYNNSSFGVARIDGYTGFADNTFGTNGAATVNFTNYDDDANSIVLQPDGKIVLAGVTGGTGNQFSQIGAARLTASGNLDPTFGASGRTVASDPNYGGSAFAALRQTDGKIVVGGRVNGYPGVRRIVGTGGGGIPININKTRGDFDGDRRADLAIFRPSNGQWWIARSGDNQTQVAQFGLAGDKPVPADYDGDAKTDIAVYRDGVWYILYSSNNTFGAFKWGTAADTPVPMNYYGTGRADLAVFDPNGFWHVISSPFDVDPTVGQAVFSVKFGKSGDIPVAGPYDDDARADFAVFRPADGTWYVLPAAGGQMRTAKFGMNGDIPQAADFDGDSKNDYAVFRPSDGTWWIWQSSNDQTKTVQFGMSGDVAVARDYDGDGKSDIAVFRPSNNVWYLLQTTNGFTAAPFGAAGDVAGN